jgi:hypothetical protein
MHNMLSAAFFLAKLIASVLFGVAATGFTRSEALR